MRAIQRPLKRLCALAGLLLLGACATAEGPSLKEQYGGLPATAEQQGRIYFYRTESPWMFALEPDVIVNGRKVGKASYGHFFYKDGNPGRYEVFLTSDRKNPIYFTLAPGESRFVKAVISFGITGTRLTAELVDPAQGRGEVENLKTDVIPEAVGEVGEAAEAE